MTQDIANLENPQPGLFDQEEPRVALALAQKIRLMTLVEALLIEIAAALVIGEAGNEQDHL